MLRLYFTTTTMPYLPPSQNHYHIRRCLPFPPSWMFHGIKFELHVLHYLQLYGAVSLFRELCRYDGATLFFWRYSRALQVQHCSCWNTTELPALLPCFIHFNQIQDPCLPYGFILYITSLYAISSSYWPSDESSYSWDFGNSVSFLLLIVYLKLSYSLLQIRAGDVGIYLQKSTYALLASLSLYLVTIFQIDFASVIATLLSECSGTPQARPAPLWRLWGLRLPYKR